MHRRNLGRLIAAGPLLFAASRPGAQPAAYPTRPVRLLVGFPAGGGVDLTARPLAEKLQQRLGQPFIVENRGGAGGNVAMDAFSKMPADGHSLMQANVGMLSINPALYRSLTFDTVRDFAPIAQIVVVPLAVMVPADLPVQTIQELVAYARARPGQLNMGSGGSGGIPHLAFELFRRRTGIDMVHVPYRGSAPALQDLMGGRVQMMIDGYNLARSAVEGGRVRVLATTGLERMPALPDIPTVHETVAPGFEALGWQGLMAPAGTPEPIIATLEAAVRWALTETDLPQVYLRQGQLPAFADRQALADRIRRERDQWTEIVRQAGITAD